MCDRIHSAYSYLPTEFVQQQGHLLRVTGLWFSSTQPEAATAQNLVLTVLV